MATTQSELKDVAEEPCDDCAELPDGWPCAHCYVFEGAEIEVTD